MSTDTAILVTDIIVNEGVNFGEIPKIYNPEFHNPNDHVMSVSLEGFVYVTEDYNVKTGKITQTKNQKPIISDKIS